MKILAVLLTIGLLAVTPVVTADNGGNSTPPPKCIDVLGTGDLWVICALVCVVIPDSPLCRIEE